MGAYSIRGLFSKPIFQVGAYLQLGLSRGVAVLDSLLYNGTHILLHKCPPLKALLTYESIRILSYFRMNPNGAWSQMT